MPRASECLALVSPEMTDDSDAIALLARRLAALYAAGDDVPLSDESWETIENLEDALSRCKAHSGTDAAIQLILALFTLELLREGVAANPQLAIARTEKMVRSALGYLLPAFRSEMARLGLGMFLPEDQGPRGR